jgi:hypothetical protein
MHIFKKRWDNWISSWKKEFVKHKYLLILSVVFLIIAVTFNYFSSAYVDRIPTTSVQDLLLDHLPTLDLDFVFVYGLILIFAVWVIYIFFFKETEFHVAISQFSFLVLIRSFFVILTHLGRPAQALALDNLPWFYQYFNYNNDLFFSAHTALPFLAFLLYKKEKIGKFFLVMTFLMAFTVLAMHQHYSIDVFSAIFITYGTYKAGQWFFKEVNHY